MEPPSPTQSSTEPQPPSSPFSQEIPQLLESHLDHLRASGIALEVIRERGYTSVLGANQPLPIMGGKTLVDLGFIPARRCPACRLERRRRLVPDNRGDQ